MSIILNQFSFMPNRSTIEAVYLIQRLMKIVQGQEKKNLHMVFTGLKKASDRVPWEVLWWCQKKEEASVAYIRVTRDIYEEVKTIVRPLGEDTNDFSIDIKFQHTSALSPFLFTIIIDDLAKGTQTRHTGVCYLLMKLSLSMRLETELTTSWSNGDIP